MVGALGMAFARGFATQANEDIQADDARKADMLDKLNFEKFKEDADTQKQIQVNHQRIADENAAKEAKIDASQQNMFGVSSAMQNNKTPTANAGSNVQQIQQTTPLAQVSSQQQLPVNGGSATPPAQIQSQPLPAPVGAQANMPGTQGQNAGAAPQSNPQSQPQAQTSPGAQQPQATQPQATPMSSQDASHVQNPNTNNSSTDNSTQQPSSILDTSSLDPLAQRNFARYNGGKYIKTQDDLNRVINAPDVLQSLNPQEQRQISAADADKKMSWEERIQAAGQLPSGRAWNMINDMDSKGQALGNRAPLSDEDPAGLYDPRFSREAMTSQGQRTKFDNDEAMYKPGGKTYEEYAGQPLKSANDRINLLQQFKAVNQGASEGGVAPESQQFIAKLQDNDTSVANAQVNSLIGEMNKDAIHNPGQRTTGQEFNQIKTMFPQWNQTKDGRNAVADLLIASQQKEANLAMGNAMYMNLNGTSRGMQTNKTLNDYATKVQVVDSHGNINTNIPTIVQFSQMQQSKDGQTPSQGAVLGGARVTSGYAAAASGNPAGPQPATQQSTPAAPNPQTTNALKQFGL